MLHVFRVSLFLLLKANEQHTSNPQPFRAPGTSFKPGEKVLLFGRSDFGVVVDIADRVRSTHMLVLLTYMYQALHFMVRNLPLLKS